jgi:hypothetical protein
VVNNSLPCALMPKRTSINVKAFLQMHRKLLRKKIIEKTFHSSLNQLASQAHESPKGFKGSARTSYRLSKAREERAPTTECDRAKANTFFIESPNSTISHLAGEVRRETQHAFLRPNMNINLNLFKKTQKRTVLKNDHLGYKLIQTFTPSDPLIRQHPQRNCKSHTVA